MQKSTPRVLLEEHGLQITLREVRTRAGDFPIKEIEGIDRRVHKPVWGPVLLALLGTLNLAIATQTGFWLDLLASAVMLAFGFFWWIRGTKYILTLKVAKGAVDVWSVRREEQLVRAMEILRRQLDKRRQ